MSGKLRPSPAMVVAIVSLVVALGGTAVAAVHFKKNSIPSSAIKSLKANKVKGKVSSAKNADTATNATTAGSATNAAHATNADAAKNAINALALGGRAASDYELAGKIVHVPVFKLSNGETRTVVTDGPLALVATCTIAGGGDFAYTQVHTTQDHSFIWSTDQSTDFPAAQTTNSFGGFATAAHGSADIDVGPGDSIVGTPDGHVITSPAFFAAVNLTAYGAGTCAYGGTLILD
jgi:hypothetical protein